MTLIFLLVAWRGWSGARGVAIAFAAGAVLVAVAWMAIRRKPLGQLQVTAESILWSRAGQQPICFVRQVSPLLHLHDSVNPKGGRSWSLTRPEVDDDPAIDLSGFDVFELRNVFEQSGWAVSMPGAP